MTFPDRSSASTCTSFAAPPSGIAVSKSVRAAVGPARRELGAVPLSTRQRATSVAPFQLA